MIFREMDPELIRAALQGQENILKDAVKQQEEHFKSLSCPMCGSGVSPALDTKKPLFKDGAPLPDYQAKCTSCGFEFAA